MSADATFPGGNGKIAVVGNRNIPVHPFDIFLMEPDGSGLAPLVETSEANEMDPAWSPDGKRIAFSTGSTIEVMDADGSHRSPVITRPGTVNSPSWSPTGDRIMFEEMNDSTSSFSVVGVDGLGYRPVRTVPAGEPEADLSWSPSGDLVAFQANTLDPDPNDPGEFITVNELFTIAPDGSNQKRLTSVNGVRSPDWSPDGSRIAFTGRVNEAEWGVLLVNAGGGPVTSLPNSNSSPVDPPGTPTWSPDGSRIAFTKGADVFVEPLAGGPLANLTSNSPEEFYGLSWQPKVAHYTVELKAWIPKREVSGFPPVPTPYLLPHGPDCFEPDGTAQEFATLVTSSFHGDGHAGYDEQGFSGTLDAGGFRVRPVANFDLIDGKIANFKVSDFPHSVGTTYNNLIYDTLGFGTHKCSISRTATKAAGGQKTSDTSFELFISSSNPLVPGAPAIDSTLEGFFTSGERLTLDYETDLFPSHGIRVRRNDDVDTFVVNDVSCLTDDAVQGLLGAGLIAYGLSRNGNLGRESLIPNEQAVTVTQSGQVCETQYRIVDVAPLAPGSGAGASASAAIEVAPLRGPGKGHFVSLPRAVKRGLVGAVTSHGRTQLAADVASPVNLRVKGGTFALETTDVDRGKVRRAALYGPAKGPLKVTLNNKIAVKQGKRTLAPHNPDTHPPRTSAKLKRSGNTVVVRFSAHDKTGVQSTIVTIGKRAAKLHHGVLKIPARKLSQVRFFSVDIYGNREKSRKLKRG